MEMYFLPIVFEIGLLTKNETSETTTRNLFFLFSFIDDSLYLYNWFSLCPINKMSTRKLAENYTTVRKLNCNT